MSLIVNKIKDRSAKINRKLYIHHIGFTFFDKNSNQQRIQCHSFEQLVIQNKVIQPRNLFTYNKKSHRPTKIFNHPNNLHHIQAQSQDQSKKTQKNGFETNLAEVQLQLIETARRVNVSQNGYPYCALGLLKAKNKEGDFMVGCGFIIDSKKVLTCASNLYNHQIQQECTKEIEIIPSILLKNDPKISGYKAKTCHFPNNPNNRTTILNTIICGYRTINRFYPRIILWNLWL